MMPYRSGLVTLTIERLVTVTVVDAKTGAPIPGAELAGLYEVKPLGERSTALVARRPELQPEATDAAGRITYLNAAAERLYGWRLEDALGQDGGELSVSPRSGDGAEMVEDLLAEHPLDRHRRQRAAGAVAGDAHRAAAGGAVGTDAARVRGSGPNGLLTVTPYGPHDAQRTVRRTARRGAR